MVDVALGKSRLVAQGLVTRPWANPRDAVAAHGAMQGQDLPGALASVALRTTGSIGDVLDALNDASLVRGYPMRGTVFLMAAADLLWVSELCNAAPMRAAVKRRAQLELTESMVETASVRAQEVLADKPAGLSRAELFETWAATGMPTDQGRGYHVLAHLIGRGELVYGPWNGADQNVVATSRWLPADSTLVARFNGDAVAATAELLRRYLTSHGPATLRDFAWWTKLPLRQISAAFAQVADELEAAAGTSVTDLDAQRWRPGLPDEVAALGRNPTKPLLLPGFDEFILGYQDRLFAMTAEQHQQLVPGNNGVFAKSAVNAGRVVGLWKRGGRPGKRTLDLVEFEPLAAGVRNRFEALFRAFPVVAE